MTILNKNANISDYHMVKERKLAETEAPQCKGLPVTNMAAEVENDQWENVGNLLRPMACRLKRCTPLS
jgi:hypothetical protein